MKLDELQQLANLATPGSIACSRIAGGAYDLRADAGAGILLGGTMPDGGCGYSHANAMLWSVAATEIKSMANEILALRHALQEAADYIGSLNTKSLGSGAAAERAIREYDNLVSLLKRLREERP